jgi:hypothetical protein
MTSRHKLLIQLRGKKLCELKFRGIGVRCPAGTKDLFLYSQVQTCSGVLPSPSNGYNRIKRLGRKAEDSLPHSAMVKKHGGMPPVPRYLFMAWCLIKHKDNFILLS